ncbi:hypothetical protein ACFSQP_05405 [Bizionia sediminis]|uniref:Uncharacterized protein n=1 Tax=Bizionia sediminis TaxID=1737064 RepID=A0ABW5KUL5_9FLAO
MQKTVAILFSVLILFQSLHISEDNFARLGVLLEHAAYHQEQYGDTFFEFLIEHYADTNVHPPSQHEEHEQLPFKDHQHTCTHSSVAFALTTQHIMLTPQVLIETPVNFYYTDSVSLFEKPAVFQPPKVA